MIAVAILIFIIILSILYQNEKRQTCPAEEEVDEDRAWLRNYLFECDKYKYERLYSNRETSLWKDYIQRNKLSRIRNYILNELAKLPRTDWEWYVLNAIHGKSPALRYYLIDEHLDLALLKKNEAQGIKDAIRAVKITNVEYSGTLREYFHLIFENILYCCRSDNPFYLRGQWRVVRALKSYMASVGEFVPSVKEIFNNNADGAADSKADIFSKLADYYDMLEELRKKYTFEINTENPVIEFDLEAIIKSRNYFYEGSLPNCLFLDLKDLLQSLTDDQFPERRSRTDKFYDGHYIGYSFGLGTIWLAKYTGAVEYFSDRLFVEFANIAPDDAIVQKLRTYKLHLEGND
jgi:hypothetical protein